jgi:hypothetical protein
MPHICGTKKGSFFIGAIFPQKLAQKTSIETRYNLFQAHVLSYQEKRSEGFFVWAVHPLLLSSSLLKIALNSLKIRGYRKN